jgi:ankyrin repeat protein
MRYSHGQPVVNPSSFSPLQLRLSEGGSALYDLCTLEFPLSVSKLLQHGADPNAKGGDLSYPLLAAVQNSRSSKHFVRALLERGAQVNASGRRGQTALHQASSLGLRKVAAVLLAFGAEIDCTDDECKTPLHLAVEHDHCEMVTFLFPNGADPDVWSYGPSTIGQHSELSPLHMAVLNRNLPMVKTLMSGNAGLEIYDNNDKTPYDMACERHDDNIRDYLEQAMKEDADQEMQEAFNDEMPDVEGHDQHRDNLPLQSPRMTPNASMSDVTNEAVAYRPAPS